MKRIPILATVVVTAAVAMMIGLGFWQLDRAQWKGQLLDRYRSAAAAPPVNLNDGGPEFAYRRGSVECSANNARVEARGGRSRADQPGYVFLVPCYAANSPRDRPIALLDIGWSSDPRAISRVSLSGRFRGVVRGQPGPVPVAEPQYILVLDRAEAGLQPSRPPSIEDIPNNHLFYAFQWFFFAAAAGVIYALTLGRRRREKLPTDGSAPKSARP